MSSMDARPVLLPILQVGRGRLAGRCSSSFLRAPPSLRFGHPDVTTDDTAPPCKAPSLPGARGSYTSGSDIRVPSRVLSAAKQGGRSAREGGFPCRSEGRYSAPTHPACRNEDDNRLSKRKLRNEPSGPPPARTYPSQPAHPEERASWRHRSSPRRARVQRLHARRRQPQG